MSVRKTVKKNKPRAMADANQRIKERNERLNKERKYYAKKLAEIKAQAELARQQREAVSSEGESNVIDGLKSIE